ncbi:MAG: flippase [Candidatus Bilamarchaeum sp.]|jgi:O-antigen/teichoic acid export membrane protein
MEEQLSSESSEMARGSFWGLVGQIAIKLVSFVYVIYIARIASQEDIGVMYLALAIVTIVGLFVEFGISGSVSRYVPYYEGSKKFGKIKSLLYWSYMSLFLQLFVGVFFYLQADLVHMFYQNPSLPGAIKVFSLLIVLNSALRIATAFLSGSADIKNSQLINNIQAVAKLILTFAAVSFFGPTIFALCIGHLTSYIIAVAFAYPKVIKVTHSSKNQDNEGITQNEFVKEILPFGIVLTAISSLVVLFTSADRLIIGYLMPSEMSETAVAIYTIATSLAIVLIAFPSSIANIFLPIISKKIGAGTKENEGLNKIINTAQRWALLITFPFGITMMVFSKEILGLFYGVNYEGGAATLAIFTIGVMIQSISYIISISLAAARRLDLELKVMIASTVVNIALNFALVPQFGIEGAAVASLISFIILSGISTYYANKLFNYRPEKQEINLFVTLIITSLIMYFIKVNLTFPLEQIKTLSNGNGIFLKIISLFSLGVMCMISLLSFLLVSILLKCYEKEDIALIQKIAKRIPIISSRTEIIKKMFSAGVPK